MERILQRNTNTRTENSPEDETRQKDTQIPMLKINTNTPSRYEVNNGIKAMKNNKAPGIGNIPAEILKADFKISTNMLHPTIEEIWEQEKVPQELNQGLLITISKKGISHCAKTGEALRYYQSPLRS